VGGPAKRGPIMAPVQIPDEVMPDEVMPDHKKSTGEPVLFPNNFPRFTSQLRQSGSLRCLEYSTADNLCISDQYNFVLLRSPC